MLLRFFETSEMIQTDKKKGLYRPNSFSSIIDQYVAQDGTWNVVVVCVGYHDFVENLFCPAGLLFQTDDFFYILPHPALAHVDYD